MSELREGRKRSTEGLNNRQLGEIARTRALRALARRYPDDYARLFAWHKRSVGWTPQTIGRPKRRAAQR